MDCPSIATTSPRNDSLLRASNHDSTIPTKCQNRDIDLPMTDRPSSAARNDHPAAFNDQPTSAARNDHPTAFNDSTDFSFPLRSSSCIQRLDRLQLPATIVQLHSTTRPISAYQHQTSSCISTTRPTLATLVERPAAHNYNYNSTIPANDVTHPS